jgi:putative membrane protein
MTVPAEPVTLTTWAVDPALVWCAAAGAAFERGRRQSPGRSRLGARAVAFWAGVAVVAVAVASPLDALAHRLFAAHMTQHLLLALVAPLLLVAAAPGRVMVWALPPPTRRAVRHTLGRLGTATGSGGAAEAVALGAVGVHVLVLAAWPVPAAYDLAVAHDVVHAIEHASLFAAGVALWWAVIGARVRTRAPLAVIHLFLAALPMGAIAALLTLAPRPLYGAHLFGAPAQGLTALEDQQLAGAIMWVPGGTLYLGVAAVLVVRWLAAGPAPGEERLAWET